MAKSVQSSAPSSVKQAIIDNFKVSDKDTGSAQVQVALLTYRINQLTAHLQSHKNDKHSRRGLLQLVGKRRKLLGFIERTEGAEVLKKVKRDVGLE